MDIAVFTPLQVPVVLRVFADVLGAGRPITPRGQQYIEVMAHLLGAPNVVAPIPLDRDAIAGAIRDPKTRKRLVQLATIAALVDGRPSHDAVATIAYLDRALAVREPAIGVLRLLADGHTTRVRVRMMRRIFAWVYRHAVRGQGVQNVWRFFRALFLRRDPALLDTAWRYRQLGLLPAGSFGHEFWQHCTERKFLFPGDGPGALPERMVFHDVGHVLTGYDTDAPGEIQQGAFQAGNVRDDGFTFLLFAVIQFHVGVKITPVADGYTGLFDIPKVMHALARGAATIDLSQGYRVWDDAARPLDEVRQRLGVPPLTLEPAA